MALTLTPIKPVHAAIWDRISTHASTSGYNLLTEGVKIEWPFLTVSAGYRGAGKSFELNVVVQVEAYAYLRGGGTQQVSTMMADVFTALNSAPITVAGYDPIEPDDMSVEDDILTTGQLDPQTGDLYAQRQTRLRLVIAL